MKPAQWTFRQPPWIAQQSRRQTSDSGTSHYNREGAQEDAQVGPKTPVLDVIEVQFHASSEGRVTPGGYLPSSGQAGGYIQPAQVFELIAVVIVEGVRPGADQAHVADQHVPELWQLVETIASKPFPDGRDSRVIRDFEHRALPFIARS